MVGPSLLMRFRSPPTAQQVDVALALLLSSLLALQLLVLAGPQSRALLAAVDVPICLGVAFRRRYPAVVGFGTQALMSATFDHLQTPAGPVTVAWFCALYALAVWTSSGVFLVALVFVVIANGGVDLLQRTMSPGIGVEFGVGAALVMALLRVVVGGRDRQLRVAERERQVAAREAVVEERERIARELHDVIAHHVSTMVMQAGAERHVLGPEQSETRDVLDTIERVGRGALTEMRRMVGMLRGDSVDDLAPQPSLSDVPALVESMQAAGLSVSLEIMGARRELARGIELSAYRVVQEALTNTYKHSRGARSTVQIRYGLDDLQLLVCDDGHGTSSQLDHGGHGLIGMRERVAMYGGSIQAGPDEQSGFAVRVRLPVR